ncbi:MAG: type II toxin-antitoxin system death-on-curing family toxin [Candidatus Paceibacterota bacterium]|jgi:death-on-curing family protein
MARQVIKRINLADVEYVAFKLAQKFMEWNEPIPDFKTRFPYKLESCIETPFQTFERKSLYKGLVEKSSILFYLMVKNHPFQNGNKRIAITTLIFFLIQNSKWLSVSDQSIYEFAREVAESKPENRDEQMLSIRSFIENNIEDYDPSK